LGLISKRLAAGKRFFPIVYLPRTRMNISFRILETRGNRKTEEKPQRKVFHSLLGRALDELDALGDVGREARVACLEELLLGVVGLADYVYGFFSAGGL